ncbi:MAG: serine/threonine-protein kinase [Chloroflexota bacterium]|nr:serine/threonine protein kinase [Chloroflexota bacterium]
MTGQLEKGKKLGQYEILAPLGKGGMASVYRAYQTNLEREVAIKVMAEQFASDPAFVERFRREARSIARLRHPNILTVYDAGEDNGLLYIVMELVEGETLREELNSKPLSLERTKQVLEQIASALDYANSSGIIHRDVKPTNVLTDKSGRVILSDFGIAKMIEASTQLTGTGMGIGTPDYMSPEQAMGEELDARSDEYSLGVMVYEMLTGRVPFVGDTPIAIVMGHVTKPLPSMRHSNPTVPPSVEQVIAKVLAKKPTERYESCGAFSKAFQDALNNPVAQTDLKATKILESTPPAGVAYSGAVTNPEAEQIYRQARLQEQQNNFNGAFDSFNLLNSRYPNYRDVPTLLQGYYHMGYGSSQTPPPVGNSGSAWQTTPPPANRGGPTGFTPPPVMIVPPTATAKRNRLIGGIGLLVLAGIIVVALIFGGGGGSSKKATPTLQAVVTATPPENTSEEATAEVTTPINPSPQDLGIEFNYDAFDKDGIIISGFTIREGLGGTVYMYGLMKNTNQEAVSFSGKANILDANGNALEKEVPIQTVHIMEADTTAPFIVYGTKAKNGKKLQWNFKVTPVKQDSTASAYYADYNFKSTDYRIRDVGVNLTFTGKVTNTGSGTTTKVQFYTVVYAADEAVLFIVPAALKDKDLKSNGSTNFEVELPPILKGMGKDELAKLTYDVWFEGSTG